MWQNSCRDRIFYINLPFCGIALVAIGTLWRYNHRHINKPTQQDHEEKHPESRNAEAPENTGSSISSISLSEFDWVGSGLMVTSSTIFLIGMSWGGNQYPWVSAAVLVPTLSGVAMFLFTIYYERFRAKNPFLRLSIFLHRSGLAVSVCTLIQSFLVSTHNCHPVCAIL